MAELHQRQVGHRRALGHKHRGQPRRVQMLLRPGDIVREHEQLRLGVGRFHLRRCPGVIRGRADLQDGVLRLLVVAAPQMYADRPGRGAYPVGALSRRDCFAAQLCFYNISKIVKIFLTLEIPPREEIFAFSPPRRRVAVGGKVQAQCVQQRCGGGLKAVPIPGQQAAALLILYHQGLGRVLPGQMRLGEAGVGQNPYLGANVQCPQRADRVGGRTVAPVLPVQQGHTLAAAQAQRPRKGINEHLIAQAPGQLRVNHARPPSLSYSCSMRWAAVFSS